MKVLVACFFVMALTGCISTAGPTTRTGVSEVAVAPISHRPSVRLGDLFGALIAGSRDLGPAPSGNQVSFIVSLVDRSSRRQAADIAAMYDPHSNSFGKYKNLKEWKAAYGPDERAVNGARALLRGWGLSSQWQSGTDWMLVSGSVRVVDSRFGVSVHAYQTPKGTRFEASARDPVVPPMLRSIVTSGGHISTYVERRGQIAPVDGLTPTHLLTAYDMQPLVNKHLDGSGMTVAFVEIDGFRQSDFDKFTSRFGLPAMHPQIKAGPSLSNVDGEAELDMEVVHEIAPAARLTVYDCQDPCSDARIVQRERQAVSDTQRGIVSISLGGCEPSEGRTDVNAEKSQFDQADGLGESVFVSSGDSGAFTCLTEDYNAAPTQKYVTVSSPASVPSVTAVGGTRLSVHPDGTWYREEAWENPPETSGTGGGLSRFFGRPSWQNAPGVMNPYNSGNAREVPDVSAAADPLTSAQIIVKGNLTEEGGTSQAAPIWAGMTALIDQYLKRQGAPVVGFMNPVLYTLARGTPSYPPYHDVTVGTNLVYPAGPGYDLATGLGTPDGWNLARDFLRYQKGQKP